MRRFFIPELPTLSRSLLLIPPVQHTIVGIKKGYIHMNGSLLLLQFMEQALEGFLQRSQVLELM